MGISIWQILIFLGGFFILFVPCILAALSKRARGWEKFFWFIFSWVFSWLGYAGYYFVRIRRPEDGRELGKIHPSRER